MATPSPIEIAETFRARLLRREASAMRAVTKAYLEAAAGIRKRIDALLSIGELSENQAAVLARLTSLQRQIESEARRFAGEATGVVSDAQIDAVSLAGEQAAQILAAFNVAPISQIQAVAGAFESGGRLAALFEGIGVGLSEQARGILVNGIAQGLSTHVVGRQLRDSLGVGLNRAMTISRTVILQTYRDESLVSYQANRDIVQGWIWFASLGPRCCGMCTALHGSKHPVDEEFSSHPRCRCTPVPIVEGMGRVQSGTAWLASQPPAVQIEILGGAGYRAIQSGAIRLTDFIGPVQSSVFGPARYQQSLKRMMGLEKAKRFYKRAA